MNRNARILAALVFTAIAVFLVTYTWLPSRSALRDDRARIDAVVAQANTWHEVMITTDNGVHLSCRARRGWPLFGPSRCPIDQFEQLTGQPIRVLHDGRKPYEVVSGNQLIVDYGAHRRAQFVAIALAVLLLTMAVATWRRK